MELRQIGWTLICFNKFFTYQRPTFSQSFNNFLQIRNYAARKGYREMAKKKKVKTVIQKQQWIPHNLRKRDNDKTPLKIMSLEHTKPQATDDVWVSRFYAWRMYSFKEVIECHRETHHPTIYNAPDAPINLFIELDMKTAKPTRFVEKFQKLALLPNVFEQDGLKERTVLAFCKTQEQKDEAMNAGANLVGGIEIIKEIEKGKIVLPDFRYVVAHPNILPEMVTIRGLLRKKFPNVKSGTLGPNMGELVSQLKNGVEYMCVKDNKLLEYGWIDVCIGRLNMEIPKLEQNLVALIDDINLQRPKRPGPFITRIVVSSPPSVEKLKLCLTPYLKDPLADEGESSDEDEAVPAQI